MRIGIIFKIYTYCIHHISYVIKKPSYIFILHNNICNIIHFDECKRICGIHVKRYRPKQVHAMIAFLTDSVCCHKIGISLNIYLVIDLCLDNLRIYKN